MNMPGFTADTTLRRRTTADGGDYKLRKSDNSQAGSVIPARPACANCDWILDNCERNGGKPAGLCAMCAVGNCY